jgi:pimeloyl-ACP methyl ester carboxylesterase
VTLVGWSYSGRIVLQVAAQHPELVKSIFIYEPGDGDGISDAAEQKAFADDWMAMFSSMPAPAAKPTDVALVRALLDTVNETPGSFDSYSPEARVPPMSCERLAEIKAPAAIVRGELTRPAFKISAEAAARCIPGARLIVVLGQRHLWPAQDAPAFTKTLLEFLDGQ